jgi:hypothetical protein
MHRSNCSTAVEASPTRSPSLTRLRLDAALYEPAPPRRPGQMGRPRLKGERLPNLSMIVEDFGTIWTPLTDEDEKADPPRSTLCEGLQAICELQMGSKWKEDRGP